MSQLVSKPRLCLALLCIFALNTAHAAPPGLPTPGDNDLIRDRQDRLLEEQRAIILLIGLEGLSYEQTAAVLRIPVGTMRSRLARGSDGLRRALGLTTTAPRVTRAA